MRCSAAAPDQKPNGDSGWIGDSGRMSAVLGRISWPALFSLIESDSLEGPVVVGAS